MTVPEFQYDGKFHLVVHEAKRWWHPRTAFVEDVVALWWTMGFPIAHLHEAMARAERAGNIKVIHQLDGAPRLIKDLRPGKWVDPDGDTAGAG